LRGLSVDQIKGYYTLPAAARELGVAYKTLYARVNRGHINTIPLGGLHLISSEEMARIKKDLKFKKPNPPPKSEWRKFKESHRGAYTAWRGMISRCTNPKSAAWDNHGGRGITVCDRWLNSFEDFLTDMGDKPPGLTLDRYPNNYGNYEPGNCRWATWSEQNLNKRPWGSVSGGKRSERRN
jgi:hypothetical protein